MIIAIDGPAGSGKSSTAKEVARRIGALFLDTGAMYRSVALYFLNRGVFNASHDSVDEGLAAGLIAELDLHLEQGNDGVIVKLNGEDVSQRIRADDVTKASSVVSRYAFVRQFLVEEQRRIASRAQVEGKSIVMEGRDIGTVVFPQADAKFFFVANLGERVHRRMIQLQEAGMSVDPARLRQEMQERDHRDSSRAESPLRKASDAMEIDTSDLSFEDQVELIIKKISGNEK